MSKPEILVVGEYAGYDFDPMDAVYNISQMDEGGTLDHLSQDALNGIQAIAFRGHSFLSGEMMDKMPALKMIANFGVGYDTIDVAHALTRGIKVSNTPDVLTEDVADLGIGMMIAWSRNIPGAQAWIKSGEWAQHGEFRLQRKVSRKRAGIVGLGRIGRAVAERLVPFKIDVSYFARSPKDTPGWTHYSDIAVMAAEVDVLFICVSGGPETAGIIGEKEIAALGGSGLLINISRGTTVDEEALLNALEGNVIAGAAMDVFMNEPHIDPRFLALDNVLLSPHQSSGTIETRTRMGELQRENIAAHFAGKPLVTPVPECA
jgi:lactate dehydrogenase-like 2-hydroxyacid dehydrogenase